MTGRAQAGFVYFAQRVREDTVAASRSGPVGFRTAQAAVAEMLRREILSGQMSPQTRLLQSEVAERFETSTTPVREALRQLVAEGLLDGDPHRGVTVHQISLEDHGLCPSDRE